jgi:comEA protein
MNSDLKQFFTNTVSAMEGHGGSNLNYEQDLDQNLEQDFRQNLEQDLNQTLNQMQTDREKIMVQRQRFEIQPVHIISLVLLLSLILGASLYLFTMGDQPGVSDLDNATQSEVPNRAGNDATGPGATTETTPSAEAATPSESKGNTSSITAPSKDCVNLNTASSTELQTLTRIGPKTAESIISYRETEGKFKKISDIQNVPRIGPKTFENLKDFICV